MFGSEKTWKRKREIEDRIERGLGEEVGFCIDTDYRRYNDDV